MRLENFLISENASLRDALLLINRNRHGVIMTSDATGSVTGLATDGDIRRQLLSSGSMDAAVKLCANPDFIWGDHTATRELLMKKLDHRVRVIPLLDNRRRLVGIVSRDHLPVLAEGSIYSRARSPVRISFCGGGSDLTHYFAAEGGAVINASISVYSHATLRIRNDKKVIIHSRDLDVSMSSDDLQSALKQEGSLRLVQAVLKTVQPNFGFELYLHSDFPMNSGLGGSAVVAATILGCFNELRIDKWNLYELAELAYQAERLNLGVAGGWQDQYATVFGGFNFMEFRMEQNIVHPLRIRTDVLLELEESLVLCDTGTTHNSGDIHHDQRHQMEEDAIRALVKANVEIAYRMRDHLLRGKLLQFGHLLDEAWQYKRRISSKISNSWLDQTYDYARSNGAIGGKLLGAGGGGFFLFYISPFRKHEFINHLKKAGLKVLPFRFEQDGLKSWSVRDETSKLNI